jgi:hypothetical protein
LPPLTVLYASIIPFLYVKVHRAFCGGLFQCPSVSRACPFFFIQVNRVKRIAQDKEIREIICRFSPSWFCQAKNPPQDIKQKSPMQAAGKGKEPVETKAFQLALMNCRWGNFRLECSSKMEELSVRKYTPQLKLYSVFSLYFSIIGL